MGIEALSRAGADGIANLLIRKDNVPIAAQIAWACDLGWQDDATETV